MYNYLNYTQGTRPTSIGHHSVWEAKILSAPKIITRFRNIFSRVARRNFFCSGALKTCSGTLKTCSGVTPEHPKRVPEHSPMPLAYPNFRGASQIPQKAAPEHLIAPKRVPAQRSPIGVLPVAPMSPVSDCLVCPPIGLGAPPCPQMHPTPPTLCHIRNAPKFCFPHCYRRLCT